MIRRATLIAGLLCCLCVWPAFAHADFGFVPGSVTVTAENQDGTLDGIAGSHPYAYTVKFAFNTDSAEELEGGEARDVVVNLPPGFVGNPQAVPQCSRQAFEGVFPQCPVSSQVGVLRAHLPGAGLGETVLPVFNVAPPSGIAGAIGASGVNLNVFQDASVRTSEEGYGLTVGAFDLPNAVISATETIWGVPAASSHDNERSQNVLSNGGSVSSEAPLQPFLTMPTSCAEPQRLEISADSKLAPGVFVRQSLESVDAGGNPASLVGCQSVPFTPSVAIAPTSRQADSSTGLDFALKLPNQGLLDPSAVAESEPARTDVVLPAGLVVNPSAATGLLGCSSSQFAAEGAAPVAGVGCPGASKVGTVTAETPLLREAIEGSVYLATPFDNPFNSLLALYLVARAPERGVLIKQAGQVETNPITGQISTSFSGLPPLPYSSFELHLREGPRAPLTTSASCGKYVATTDMAPFSAPGVPVSKTSEFQITTGAGGGACTTPGSEPFAPAFSAGTVSPVAGGFSPFQLNLMRENGSQRITAIDATLPLGLVGKLAGIPYCSDAQIATATARANPGDGRLEQNSPSCPLASEVGTVTVGAGSGAPYYAVGHAYLAGPYKGAPLSLEIVTPAVAGPFDLGVVAVRTALYVNETTAQIHAVSDPLPTILQGIPLDIRSIALSLARPQFVLNPTNCEPMSVLATAVSASGRAAALSNRFQVGGCKGLDFSPQLKLSLTGPTTRGKNPALKAVLTQPPGQANIGRVSVTLPKSEFIDNRHINNPCTRVQFNSGAGNGAGCPAKSILGHARAYTPLLDQPLEGPVYFRSNGGERKLPDIVAALHGQVSLNVVGFVDSVREKGTEVTKVRNTFATVPDAPVTKFVLELDGGKKGLLQNSTNLCKAKNEAEVKLKGQNGKVFNNEVAVTVKCKKRQKKPPPKKH